MSQPLWNVYFFLIVNPLRFIKWSINWTDRNKSYESYYTDWELESKLKKFPTWIIKREWDNPFIVAKNSLKFILKERFKSLKIYCVFSSPGRSWGRGISCLSLGVRIKFLNQVPNLIYTFTRLPWMMHRDLKDLDAESEP